MSELPKTMKAIKNVGVGKAEIQEVSVPKMRDDYVLVKVNAVALNPTDWYVVFVPLDSASHYSKLTLPPHRKHIHYEPLAAQGKGCTVGCDYAGTVVQVGPKVTKDFKVGDRIAGFTHGVNSVEKEDGCFAEYAVAKGDVQCKLPDNISDEEASTLGVGVTTVGQALYQSLGLPLPGGEKANEPLLIYGGSTATGSLAIQFAVLSGCKVITTCSPRNFPFVKALGAAEAFDYNDPDVAKKIREYTDDKLTKVFDCISEGASPKISSEAISSKGGKVTYLLATKHDRTDVENKVSLLYLYTHQHTNKSCRPPSATPSPAKPSSGPAAWTCPPSQRTSNSQRLSGTWPRSSSPASSSPCTRLSSAREDSRACLMVWSS
jgi:NADPH:quinone reductase-like Zn-dependent oxidoreductase